MNSDDNGKRRIELLGSRRSRKGVSYTIVRKKPIAYKYVLPAIAAGKQQMSRLYIVRNMPFSSRDSFTLPYHVCISCGNLLSFIDVRSKFLGAACNR